MEETRKIKLLVVHCSASDLPAQDSVEAIKELHTSPSTKEMRWGKYLTNGNGWSDIGYHYIITRDGEIHLGRPLHIAGAHVKGYNAESIGICLTGDKMFTDDQFDSLRYLCEDLCAAFGLERFDILHHRDLDSNKTCPNFDLFDVLSGGNNSWKRKK